MGSRKKKKSLFYRFCVSIAKIFYRKRKFVGIENIPEEPSLIIGNHAQIHGPVSCEFYFPTYKSIWCIGEMMNIKEVPAYAYKDFWSYKPKWIRWFYKILSYIIAPICSYYLNQADTIAVYKDTRLLKTFRDTMEKLDDGANVVIFPECHQDFNDIVCEFQDKFVDVAKIYYNKTGKCLSFVPMYNAATIKTIVFGTPIKYNPLIDMKEQRKIICEYLKQEITKLAKELPVHKVVPYKNIKKKNYVNSR